jgi:hypothetical protein
MSRTQGTGAASCAARAGMEAHRGGARGRRRIYTRCGEADTVMLLAAQLS